MQCARILPKKENGWKLDDIEDGYVDANVVGLNILFKPGMPLFPIFGNQEIWYVLLI